MPRPPSSGRVTSPYGERPKPTPTSPAFHYGEDTIGDGNYAPVAGVITQAAYVGSYGNRVVLEQASDRSIHWWLCHNASLPKGYGTWLAEGDWVAPMGATGNVTGVHVHTERRINASYPGGGTHTNPRSFYGSTAGGGNQTPISTPEQQEEQELSMAGVADGINRWTAGQISASEGRIVAAVVAQIERTISAVRREERFRRFGDTKGRRALGRTGKVINLGIDQAAAAVFEAQISVANPLRIPSEEVNGSLPVVDETAFFSYVDDLDPEGDHGFGKFVKNTQEVKDGINTDTRMIRELNGKQFSISYASRQLVWANAQAVEITYGGKPVVEFIDWTGTGLYVRTSDGKVTNISPAERDRIQAQKPTGQNWTKVTSDPTKS